MEPEAARSTQVQPESRGDEPGIAQVLRLAFPSDAEARLVDALRRAGRLSVSLVAFDGAEMVGCIAFSPVTIQAPAGGATGLGLGPVAVLPAARKRGIGARLVQTGLEACALAGTPFVVVLGNPTYYRRFGFQAAYHWGIRNEYDAHEEFMAKELRAGGIPRPAGLAQYAQEFALVS